MVVIIEASDIIIGIKKTRLICSIIHGLIIILNTSQSSVLLTAGLGMVFMRM